MSTDSKPELDAYPGLVSDTFSKIFTAMRQFLASKNIVITPEFTFFFALAAYIFLDNDITNIASKLNTPTIVILTLVGLNLLWPNLPQIKRTIFSTDEEKLNKILKICNEQEALSKLGNFLASSGTELKITKKIFSRRFADNYEAYDLFFKNVSMDESEVNYLIQRRVINKPFFNELLMENFLAKTPWTISYSTYQKLKQIIRERNFSSRIRKLFNYRYCRYSDGSLKQTVLIHEREKAYLIVRKLLMIMLAASVAAIYIFGAVAIISAQTPQNAAMTTQIANVVEASAALFAIGIALLIIIHIVNWFMKQLFLQFLVKDTI
ncbi:MAG: hypothetical protein WCT52_01675 [Candidatus Micrarchaeia archaeon]|jgi:hypothetical protein